MWTVVYIAANRTQADEIREMLCREGVLANMRPTSFSALGDGLYEIMVLESEADEAQALLCQFAAR